MMPPKVWDTGCCNRRLLFRAVMTVNIADSASMAGNKKRGSWMCRHMRVVIGGIGLFVFFCGCKVTPEKVEKWKRNGDAPRLKKCLSDKNQSIKVRVAAGLALFHLNRYYGAEVMLQRVKERNEKEAAQIADGIANKLKDQVKGTSEEAIKAKDGLFSVWAFVPAKTKVEIETLIIKWLMDNYTSVAQQGEHSAKKIIDMMGPKAGALMAQQLTLGHPNLREIAILIQKLAPPEVRDQLVARFVKELEGDQRKQSDPDKLYAIGYLCGPKALEFLQKTVGQGLNYTIKRNAIIGLRICQGKSSLKAIFTLLGDLLDKAINDVDIDLPVFSDHKPALITQGFELIDAVKDYKMSKTSLLRLVSTHGVKTLKKENQKRKLLIRMNAGRSLILMGQVDGVRSMMESLPVADKYPPGYVYLVVYAIKDHINKSNLPEVLKVLRESLNSKNWVARLVSVETLALLGNKAVDAPLLGKLSKDPTKLAEWEGTPTLGERVTRTIKKLENR